MEWPSGSLRCLLSDPVTFYTCRLKFLSVFNFENTVNFSMDSKAKFPDIRFAISPREIVQISSKTSRSGDNDFRTSEQYFRSAAIF